MSRIMPTFCSSVRPAAMLTVISGIVYSLCFVMAGRKREARLSYSPAIHVFLIKQDVDARHKAGHDDLQEWLSPLHVMPRQNFLHGLDQHALVDLGLGLALPLQIFLAVLDLGEPRAKDQILDLHLAPRLLVRALHDRARRIAAVGIFHLLADRVLGIAEIELGTDARVAQARNHLLVIGDVAAEHRDHDGAVVLAAVELAQHRERRLQARHADGEAGRRHRLAAEARHESIIPSAATDRAEAHGAALLVLGLEQKLNLEHGARVIFETSDDGGIDLDPVFAIARRDGDPADLVELVASLFSDLAFQQSRINRRDALL